MAGEDRHAMLEHTAKLRAALAALHGEVQTVALDGAQAAMADVLDELRSVGLMVATKLVIVENTEALLRADDAPSGTKTPRELLEYYCKAPEPTSWLVLRVGSGKWIPGKLPDAIKSCGGRVENFAPQTPQDAQAWAVDRARNHHKVPIDLSAAQQLVEQVGVEQGRLDCELAKLAITALVRGQASITAELVAEMSGQTREDEVWAVQSCVLQDDAARVLAGLQDLVVISRHTPASLSWAMVDLARKLDGFARGAAAKENPFATGGRVKAFGAGRALVEKFGPRLSPVTTGALLASAVRCDAMNKSGRGDPARNIEVMALRFVAAVRQAAR
jgi:DNA polymerase III delta subunit